MVDGIALLSVSNNVIRTTLPFWLRATVEVFPERLEPGSVISWYATGSAASVSSTNLIYTQVASANGNSTDTYINEGADFYLKVPVTGLNLTSTDRFATVSFSIGQPGQTKVGCGQFSVLQMRSVGSCWKFGQCSNDPDEDDEESDLDYWSSNGQ